MTSRGTAAVHADGVLFSTPRNRWVARPSLCFWYLQRSKKVWFRLDRDAVIGHTAVFTFRGRPILHRSEVAQRSHGHPLAGRQPVVWGDIPTSGFAPGPAGTVLYLKLWTRWTWLHPEACGRPELFGVDVLVRAGAEKANPGGRMRP